MLKKSPLYFYLLLSLLALTPFAQGQDSFMDSTSSNSSTSLPADSFKCDVDFYINRYSETDLLHKITNGFGNGCNILYGTRNMRPVLHGIAYRGGANNYFHHSNKRKNSNPLPKDGVQNLCAEGFSHAVYLYRTNADEMKPSLSCDCITGNPNTMAYSQLDYYDTAHIHKIIQLVYESALDDNKGPVYLHCWNGWHASGFIAAILLKQFCGYSDMDAINYWDLGTDGMNKSSRYQKIRNNIQNFKPYPEFQISDSLGNYICPKMPEVIDSSKLHIGLEHLLLVPESIPTNYALTLYDVSFDAGATSISNIHKKAAIKTLLKALQLHSELQIEIGGHTDNSGSASTNRALSEKRAKFIYDYLIRQKIPASRISYKGYGEAFPRYNNKYSSNRKKNRRIEVKLIKNISFDQTK